MVDGVVEQDDVRGYVDYGCADCMRLNAVVVVMGARAKDVFLLNWLVYCSSQK